MEKIVRAISQALFQKIVRFRYVLYLWSMIRILVVVLWIGFAFSLFGQAQPNPFDLQYRPQKSKKSSLPDSAKPEIDSPAIKHKVSDQKVLIPPDLPVNGKPDSALLQISDDSLLSEERVNPFELGVEVNSDSITISMDQTKAGNPKEPSILPPVSRGKPMSRGLLTFFLLLSLLFLIFIVNVERNFVKDLWRVISNENYSSLHLRNQRNTMRQILLMMGYMIFIVQAGIFFYHFLIVFNLQGQILDNIWACMGFVLVIYITRHAMVRYLRWLFNNEKEMTLFGFDISIFNIMVGLILLPINVLFIFGPDSMTKPLIIIGVMIIALAYLMRQLRWMLTARHLIVNSLFLFFVYLCAVEILPLWAISKFFW